MAENLKNYSDRFSYPLLQYNKQKQKLFCIFYMSCHFVYFTYFTGHGEVIQSCLEGDWIGLLFQTMSALLAKRNRQQMLNLIQSTETSTKQIG